MTFKQVPTDPRTPAPPRREPTTSPGTLAQIMEASDYQSYTPIGPQHVGQMGVVHMYGLEDNIRAALCHKQGHVLAMLGVDARRENLRAEEIRVVGMTSVTVGGVPTWVRAWMNVWVRRDREDQAVIVSAPIWGWGWGWHDPHTIRLTTDPAPAPRADDGDGDTYAVPIIRLGGEFICADGGHLRWSNLPLEVLEQHYARTKYGW